jgi:hypothetical protein
VTSWPQVIQPIFVARGETCAWITFHVVIAKALGESQETLAGMMIARTYGFALRRESTRIKEGRPDAGIITNGQVITKHLECIIFIWLIFEILMEF